MPQVLVDVVVDEDCFVTPTRAAEPAFSGEANAGAHGNPFEEDVALSTKHTPDGGKAASDVANTLTARRRLFSFLAASVTTTGPVASTSTITVTNVNAPDSLGDAPVSGSIYPHTGKVNHPQALQPLRSLHLSPPQPPQSPPRSSSPAWHQVTDPAGRPVFVNSATGHTSLAPPTFTGATDGGRGGGERPEPAARPRRPLMVMMNEQPVWYPGAAGFQRPLLLTHGFSPFLPRGRLRLPPPPPPLSMAEATNQHQPPPEQQTAQRFGTVTGK